MIESTKISVQLSGENGNVFNLIAICRKAMRKAGHTREEIDEFTARVQASKSYDAALVVMMGEFDVS